MALAIKVNICYMRHHSRWIPRNITSIMTMCTQIQRIKCYVANQIIHQARGRLFVKNLGFNVIVIDAVILLE